MAIQVILALLLENAGYHVDFALPWILPHSGDYDLEELFAQIDGLCMCEEIKHIKEVSVLVSSEKFM